MGNQPSRSTTPTSNPQSPSAHSSSHAPASLHGHAASGHGHGHGHAPHGSHGSRELNPANPRRRESIQALSFRAAAAPPSASLESAVAHPTVARPHSRSRSQTIAAAAAAAASGPTTAQVAHQLRAHDLQHHHHNNNNNNNHNHSHNKTASEHRDRDRDRDSMGNEQSRQKEKLNPSKPGKLPSHQQPSPSPQTRPVDVPAAPREESQASRAEPVSSIDPADASQEYFIPPSQYSRPPRLPLPIEEEVHTPGSPIITPADLSVPLDPIDIEGALPRPTSVLSSTTAEDEDDLEDEFRSPGDVPTVPTLIEWEGPGERVYVTGTFAGWDRKYRLHRNGPSKKRDVLSAYVNIAPGTHHLKFLVDNDMRTSDKLPTAVDYTNILVNYLEVSYDDVPKPAGSTDEVKDTQPIPVQELPAPSGIFPPQTLPPTPELLPVKPAVPEPPKPQVPAPAPRKYHSRIPDYLLDLDADEESSRFSRANAAVSNLPTPPTLPMFLSKSILNGTTPMKDDSSVLIMPNHTVLNHLATSSIKDNILATSATTRYKQKFLTTIMYKPKYDGSERERE